MVAIPSPDIIVSQGVQATLNRREANLGSRYRRTSRGGLNPVTLRVSVAWTLLTPADAVALHDTLLATAGVDPIEFTLKDESTQRSWLLDVASDRQYINQVRERVQAVLIERHLP